MKLTSFTLLLLLFTASAYSQSEFNLGFEKVNHGKAEKWGSMGASGYSISIDSTVSRSGKYSSSITYNQGEPGYSALTLTIPDSYEGKRITLSGFIRTENVSDGFAGLWIRIDPSVGYQSMEKNGVTGTTSWEKYEISLDLKPERTQQILLGGLLVGKGKMWLDDLAVTIDGKDIRKLKPYQKTSLPADLDKEFEKGSKIEPFAVDQSNTDRLKLTGLIWGFLKYYHPEVAKGNYNWDFELFRILPQILSAKNNGEAEAVFVKWINRLGDVEEMQKESKSTDERKMQPDLAWIDGCSAELRSLLLKVKNAKRTGKHYYVGLMPNVGNPDFKNENPYFDSYFPDTGFRLLALYRYWNIIQYYFPYKYLIEEDWKNVLVEFIPEVLKAGNETEYALVMLKLIARVNDTHANIYGNETLDEYFGVNYANVDLSFVENKAVVTGFHSGGEEEGLKPGDIITSINNKPVDEIIREKAAVSPASNHPTQLRVIAAGLLRSNDSLIHIQYTRDNVPANTSLKTYAPGKIKIQSRFYPTDTCYKAINRDIAYINNGSMKKKYLSETWENIRDTKGLIIDIRNYPSDFIIYDLCNYLMPESTPFVKFTNGSIDTPGLFTFTRSLNVGKNNKNYYKGKVVILVDETTQSSAEFHSMAYRIAPRAVVIGSTTAAADGNISQFYLPGAIPTVITGIGVYYPDGRETQRVGIVPDIEVKPTIEGIKNGRDEVLEKAIEIINKE